MINSEVLDHLSKNDPVIGTLISKYGDCTLEAHSDHYMELLSSIVSQQLSVKAASTIWGRVVALFGGKTPTPEQILEADTEELRGCGVSYSKVRYMKDLAVHLSRGDFSMESLVLKPNNEIIAELTQVKGIGVWTVHMFLIFSLGRLDVLPTGDLGIKNAITMNYSLDHVPTEEEIVQLAEKNGWHPYSSVVSWYLWKSLDNK